MKIVSQIKIANYFKFLFTFLMCNNIIFDLHKFKLANKNKITFNFFSCFIFCYFNSLIYQFIILFFFYNIMYSKQYYYFCNKLIFLFSFSFFCFVLYILFTRFFSHFHSFAMLFLFSWLLLFRINETKTREFTKQNSTDAKLGYKRKKKLSKMFDWMLLLDCTIFSYLNQN